MAFPEDFGYDDDDLDDLRRARRRSISRGRAGAFLDPGFSSRLRARSTGQAPNPVVNIFNDQVQDSNLRAESPYHSPPLYPPVPYHRGRSSSGRLDDDLVDDLANMALRERVRSRSRGWSDFGYFPGGPAAPDYYAWQLEEMRQRERWEREAEIRRMREDARRKAAADAAEAEKKKTIADYEEKQRKEKERAKEEEARIREKLAQEKRDKEQKEKEEKQRVEAEMRKRLAAAGYPQWKIDMLVDEERAKRPTILVPGATAMEVWRPGARSEKFIKVHRDHLSIDTLVYYDIPYEWDRDYILIKREMDKYETDLLFEHTRRLRAGRLLIEAPARDKQYAWFRRRRSDRSSSRRRSRVGVIELR